VACAWLLNIVMTIYSIFGSKTLLRPKAKLADREDFYAYHGLHQGEVFEDRKNVDARSIHARQQDIENGKAVEKRYMQDFSNGA
jgi:hypothetical protein